MRNGQHRVRRKDWRRRWVEIKLMERTALRVWAEKARRRS